MEQSAHAASGGPGVCIFALNLNALSLTRERVKVRVVTSETEGVEVQSGPFSEVERDPSQAPGR